MDSKKIKQKSGEPTNKEILKAINAFSFDTDKHFKKVESRLGKVESNMVTKDYLDDKLADLRGDLVVLTRKEDTKVKKLIQILNKRNLISDDEVKEALFMEPFAQLFV
ncbi:hypothetical protein L6248_02535 [Candidatus Parcubacteria bacterium]|nr:hypothetical protein [Candidatus Parcubacteria bacterium]MCG2700725.1 hypothetical protein [Candidatus Parcubacteria bacterium]